MIDEGTHRAVAIDRQWGTANDKKQIVVAFQILSGPQAGQGISWFGYFTKKTYERTMKSLRYCGWKGDDLMDMGPLDQVVEIVVEHEEYEGKTRAKVAWVNRPGGGRVKLKNPMSEDEIRMFAAQMKAKCSSIAEVSGERVDADAAMPPPQDAPPTFGDDDIPF